MPLSRNIRNAFCMLRYLLFEGNCRQFDVTLARKLSIVAKFLNVIQRNQYRGKIIKRESCGINNFLQDQGSKFPSLWGSGIKILSEKNGISYEKNIPRYYPAVYVNRGSQLSYCRFSLSRHQNKNQKPFDE